MPMQLLATKLYVPPPRAESVTRWRLLDRLDGGRGRKLILISTPAGFGKTTLMSQWHAARRGGNTGLAWVLLDEQDNDPLLFWSYVLTAIDKVLSGAGSTARRLLHTSRPPGALPGSDRRAQLQAVLTALMNDLASAQEQESTARPLVLVLDDYHTINVQAVHDSLAFFLDYLPPAVQVVILTRADPPLPLARLRARDQLLELRAADLRFTADEVDLFLNQAMALALPPEAVAVLDARTEGWPAGLHLAALSLQGLDARQARRFVGAFAGTHRHVLNYLTEDVLLRQPEAVQTFLLHTAILPYLTAGLCDAVMSQPGSQQMLEQLAENNLFTTPLDAAGQWYRYHPLFADTLRARLQQSSPDLLPILHRRASAWHESHGAVSDAMRHALAIDDKERAAHLIEASYKRLVMRGEMVTLQRWLDTMPGDLVRARPKLCLAYAVAYAYSGLREQVEDRLQQAENALAAGGDTPDTDAVRGEIAALRAVLASVNWAGECSVEFAQEALQLLPPARTPEDLWVRALTLQAQGNCYRFQGQVKEAEEYYSAALAAARALDSAFLAQAVTNRLAQNQLHQGRLRQAAHTLETALHEAEGRGGEMWWFAGELYGHLGWIYTEWNDLDRALHHVQRGIELGRQAESPHALLQGYLMLATLHTIAGRDEAASEALELARQSAVKTGVSILEAQVAALRASLRLSRSRRGAPDPTVRQWAEGWASRRARAESDGVPLVQCELQDLILAEFWLTQGQFDQALELVAGLQAAAEAAGRVGTVIPCLVLSARALYQQGNLDRSRDSLRRALALAEPDHHVRTFAQARSMLNDLRLAMDSQPASSRALAGYLEQLLAELPGPHPSQSRTESLLTAREIEILHLMAGGAPNQEIAQRLVVTVGTVKGHVNRILDKLDARNRTEAVARAREWGLLES